MQEDPKTQRSTSPSRDPAFDLLPSFPFPQELPPSLAALPALASLQAGHNQLAELPPGLGARQQPGLAVLAAPANRLAGLPPGLSEAAALTRLDVSGNALEVLPGFIMPGMK